MQKSDALLLSFSSHSNIFLTYSLHNYMYRLVGYKVQSYKPLLRIRQKNNSSLSVKHYTAICRMRYNINA